MYGVCRDYLRSESGKTYSMICEEGMSTANLQKF